MNDDLTIDDMNLDRLRRIASFIDQAVFVKITNKITDYAEIISEGKLSAIVNFSYNLNRQETNDIIQLLLDHRAISRIGIIAQKGTKDLDNEYISNILSNPVNPESESSYISLRNILENRLTHQVQQYNMNMGKSNSTQSMPVNELRGHVRTFLDLSSNNISISTRVQHGYIAASLHDAYITLINRHDFWNDKTYIKFFFNEDDNERRNQLIVTHEQRQSLIQISRNINEITGSFEKIRKEREDAKSPSLPSEPTEPARSQRREEQLQPFSDPAMATPFGRQYGGRINSIIADMFNHEKEKSPESFESGEIPGLVEKLFSIYISTPAAMTVPVNVNSIMKAVDSMILLDMEMKTFVEKFLYRNRKESFSRYYSENKEKVDSFVTDIFAIYFEEKIGALFRIIRSQELRTFACAFTIKRIYFTQGENLTSFGYFLVKAVARVGKIQTG
jgi:hypothetical protein